MEYKISMSENGKYLFVEVFEAMTRKLTRRVMKEGLAESKAHGMKNVFVDVSKVTNDASVLENYMLAYKDAALLGHPQDIKVAVFVGMNDQSHDFIETTLKNAGYILSTFRDKRLAIEWLEK